MNFQSFCRFRKCVSFRRFKQTDSIFLFPPKKCLQQSVFFRLFLPFINRELSAHTISILLSLSLPLYSYSHFPLASQHTKQTTAKRKKTLRIKLVFISNVKFFVPSYFSVPYCFVPLLTFLYVLVQPHVVLCLISDLHIFYLSLHSNLNLWVNNNWMKDVDLYKWLFLKLHIY